MMEALLRAPWLFSFYQAVRVAEVESGRSGLIGSLGPVAEEPVRFRGQYGLGFPSSEISAIRLDEDVSEGEGEGSPWRKVEMEATLLSLYGSVSPLPSDVTEMIIQRDDTGTMRDFLDIYNHRLISLLYRIWRTAQVDLERRADLSDQFSFAIRCLAGLGHNDIEDRIDKGSLLHDVRHLVGWTRSASDLRAVLTGQFPEGEWAVEEFVAREFTIAPEFQWRLGWAEPSELGEDVVLGDRMEDITGRIRIWVRARDWLHYCDLLPGGETFHAVQQVVRRLLRDPLDVLLVPFLPVEALRPAQFDGASDGGQLGLNSWLDRPAPASKPNWPGFPLGYEA